MKYQASHPTSRSAHEAIRFSVIWIASVLAILSLARVLQPDSATALSVPGVNIVLPELCSFRRFTAMDCPGCGLTRSFVLAVRFRFSEAWAIHPVGMLLVVYLTASLAQRLWWLRRLRAGTPTRSTLMWELALVICLVAAAYLRWAVLCAVGLEQ